MTSQYNIKFFIIKNIKQKIKKRYQNIIKYIVQKMRLNLKQIKQNIINYIKQKTPKKSKNKIKYII